MSLVQASSQANESKSPMNSKVEASKSNSALSMIKNTHITEIVAKLKESKHKGFNKHLLNCSDLPKNRNPFYDNRKLSTNKPPGELI